MRQLADFIWKPCAVFFDADFFGDGLCEDGFAGGLRTAGDASSLAVLLRCMRALAHAHALPAQDAPARDIERAVRLDGARREMVPAPQIFDRDVESIGNCHQRVARSRDVVQRMRRRDRSRDWDDEFVAGRRSIASASRSIGRGDL